MKMYTYCISASMLQEKDLVHKLFKVLAPRYESSSSCYTSIHKLGITYPGRPIPMSILELKGKSTFNGI